MFARCLNRVYFDEGKAHHLLTSIKIDKDVVSASIDGLVHKSTVTATLGVSNGGSGRVGCRRGDEVLTNGFTIGDFVIEILLEALESFRTLFT